MKKANAVRFLHGLCGTNSGAGIFRILMAVLWGIFLMTGTVTAFEVTGTFEGIDAGKSRVQFQVNGQDRILAIANDVQTLGTDGKPLMDGLKSEELKAGIKVTITVEQGPDGPIIRVIRLGAQGSGAALDSGKTSVGLKPLNEMTVEDRYKGEDGGLYGGGRNDPPELHRLAAQGAVNKITPLDAQGKPAKDGRIVFISLGMSNTYGEFSMFKEVADSDPQKSPDVLLVNCAVGGAGVSSWAKPGSGVWQTVAARLKEANVTPEQVQVAWVKHAEPGPEPDSSPLEYAKKVKENIELSLAITRSTFPNLRVVFLSSRIYGGYNTAGLRKVNPEPFAYETAFSVRWVIQDQINSEKNNRTERPVLLWGPYLWADGVTPRKSDKLVWERTDLTADGVHPSMNGRQKVVNLLLEYFKNNPDAKIWFVKK